jgi:hypothetical protein
MWGMLWRCVNWLATNCISWTLYVYRKLYVLAEINLIMRCWYLHMMHDTICVTSSRPCPQPWTRLCRYVITRLHTIYSTGTRDRSRSRYDIWKSRGCILKPALHNIILIPSQILGSVQLNIWMWRRLLYLFSVYLTTMSITSTSTK